MPISDFHGMPYNDILVNKGFPPNIKRKMKPGTIVKVSWLDMPDSYIIVIDNDDRRRMTGFDVSTLSVEVFDSQQVRSLALRADVLQEAIQTFITG